MNTALIGVIGIYLIGVGWHGNVGVMADELSGDARGFVPWLLAVIILRALYNVDSLRPFLGPLIGLAILTWALKNFAVIAAQVNELYGSEIVPV